MSTLLDRFRTYPPLMQWLLGLAVVVTLFLAWQTFVWGLARSWNDQAAEYVKAIEQAEKSERLLSQRTQAAMVALGESAVHDKKHGMQAIGEAIARVLDAHAVRSRDVDTKPMTPFSPRERLRMIPPGVADNGARISAEVRFEATPEAAFGVVRDLESSPEIATVTMVRMSRSTKTQRAVNVHLAVEAWVADGLPQPQQVTMPASDETEAAEPADDESVSNIAGAAPGSGGRGTM